MKFGTKNILFELLKEVEKPKEKFIFEISQKELDKVDPDRPISVLPFDEIFEGKRRILVNYVESQLYAELREDLKTLRNFYDVRGTNVIKEIQIPEDKGGGEKHTKISIGKAINYLNVSEEKKKKYREFFALHSKDFENLQKGYDEFGSNDKIFLLTRDPIDLAKMSDHETWSSCHSPGGGEFCSALMEAKDGGAMAYIIRKRDYEKNIMNSEEGLEKKEIFKDKDRGVEGISPISRMRVWKFVDVRSGKNYAIPDSKIYGSRIPNFYETIRSFLYEKQNIDKDEMVDLYNSGNLERRGGEYNDDTDDKTKFVRFLQLENPEVLKKYTLDYSGEEIEDESRNELEAELERIKNQSGIEEDDIDVHYDVQDDDDVYYTCWASFKVEIPEIIKNEDFNEDFEKLKGVHKEYMIQFAKGRTRGFHVDKQTPEFAEKIFHFFSLLDDKIKKRFVGIDFAEEDGFLIVSLEPEEVAQYDDGDNFETFCSELLALQQYNYKKQIIRALMMAGFINSAQIRRTVELLQMEEEDDENIQIEEKPFKNMKFDRNEYVLSKRTEVPYLDPYDYITVSRLQSLAVKEKVINTLDIFYFKEIEKYARKYIMDNLDREDEREGYVNFKEFFGNVNKKIKYIKNLDFDIKFDIDNFSGINMRLKVETRHLTDNELVLFHFFDDYWEHISRLITLVLLDSGKVKNPGIERYKRFYGKYLR